MLRFLCVAVGLASLAAHEAPPQQPPVVVRQGQSSQPVALRVAFGGGGRWLAECGASVRIFDVATGRVTRSITVPLLYTWTCAAHPTADLIALSTVDAAIVVFDVTTGSERWRTAPMARAMLWIPGRLGLSFSPDGSELHATLMTGPIGGGDRGRRGRGVGIFRRSREPQSGDPYEGVVSRWSVETGRQLALEKTRSIADRGVSNEQSKISTDGSRELLVGFTEGWRVTDSKSGLTIAAPPSTPLAADWALSPDGRMVATVQRDTLILGDLGDPVTYRYLGGGAAGRFVTVEDALKASAVPRSERSDGPESPRALINAVTPSAAFSIDNRWFVARAQDGQIDVWDSSTGTRMPFRLPAPTNGDYASDQMPIAVQSSAAASAEEGWQPLVVENVRYGQTLCRSLDSRFVAERGSGADGYVTAILRDRAGERRPVDLLALGLDLSGGCLVGPDGTRVLVSAVESSPVRVREIKPRMLGRGLLARETEIVMADATGRGGHLVLRDRRSGRPIRVPFGAGLFEWSSDGRFVVVGGDGLNTLRVWTAATGQEVDLAGSGLEGALRGRFVGGANLAVRRGGEVYSEIWNLDGLTRVAGNLTHVAANTDPTNGVVLVNATSDGLLEIRRLVTGELLGELTALRGGDWLVTTPSGYFDGSPGGWQRLVWRTQAGIETAPGELYFDEFYRPGLLAQLLEGHSPGPGIPITERDRRQPVVRVAAAMAADRQADVTVDVSEAAAGSGVRDVRLFRNGSLVEAWRGDQPLERGARRLEARVAVTAGRNVFTAYAFNRGNVKSLDATVAIESKVPARTPTVYVLAIGVNAYANTAFDLVYARPTPRRSRPSSVRVSARSGRTPSCVSPRCWIGRRRGPTSCSPWTRWRAPAAPCRPVRRRACASWPPRARRMQSYSISPGTASPWATASI